MEKEPQKLSLEEIIRRQEQKNLSAGHAVARKTAYIAMPVSDEKKPKN